MVAGSRTQPSSEQDGMSEQERLQHQLQIFQDSLPKVNQLAYQMLLNEMVPLAVSVENRLAQTEHVNNSETIDSSGDKDTVSEMVRDLHISPKLDLPSHKLCLQLYEAEEERKKRILERLRSMGFQTGNKLSELLVFSNNPNLTFKDMDLLAIMKFICRDVWKQMFGKQIDNLKTNHRGTFYLFDYEYRPIQPFALDDQSTEKELEMVKPFLEIPVGVIKGVLSSLGYKQEQVVCLASYIDRPADRPKSTFPKGISFHVQVNK
ncbi:hypothetical protein HG536_0D03230 [Torulaspora globosa]|uniref:Trafficking protein particle complex subunit 33 n=1 Tax=Torulaspora globosa TaxID=48254 RepID=A0A7G3ZH15_9SACH|nr:uncharacterized protein HG536_0D03230 [Torulaspora globosa]QLL32801.1 hypothetical protein HG536_0D03230 [Torulaspora globosa]